MGDLNLAGDLFRGNKRKGFGRYNEELLAVEGIECFPQPKGKLDNEKLSRKIVIVHEK